ncbi:hypothetical protein ZIOFF_026089 [Zingiber officinale]|uniref:Uncharacterized protein n=1 Tax=Zingiber officinale TaxID=94328 RepID=A0A8J5HG84_ZINOF|nr:hypothetical protein ZIOFF_026089 [Zingiber officinale]
MVEIEKTIEIISTSEKGRGKTIIMTKEDFNHLVATTVQEVLQRHPLLIQNPTQVPSISMEIPPTTSWVPLALVETPHARATTPPATSIQQEEWSHESMAGEMPYYLSLINEHSGRGVIRGPEAQRKRKLDGPDDMNSRAGSTRRTVMEKVRGGFKYFVSFIDDYSRYGYIYLMRRKSKCFDKFKKYKNDVEKCQVGIQSQLTAPSTPQRNGVEERRPAHVLKGDTEKLDRSSLVCGLS